MRVVSCPKCKATLEVYLEEGSVVCPRCGILITVKKLK